MAKPNWDTMRESQVVPQPECGRSLFLLDFQTCTLRLPGTLHGTATPPVALPSTALPSPARGEEAESGGTAAAAGTEAVTAGLVDDSTTASLNHAGLSFRVEVGERERERDRMRERERQIDKTVGKLVLTLGLQQPSSQPLQAHLELRAGPCCRHHRQASRDARGNC